MKKKLKAETGNEERIHFFKELYSFNALLDIDIDEENFQGVQNKGALKSNLDFIEGKLESFSSLFQELNLKESVSGLIKAVHENFEKEDKVPFDAKLHGIWQDFIDKYATIDKDAEPNVKRQALRLKGLSLLLMTKYVRALLMSNPLQANLSDDQDALTRFASANLSHVYATDDPEESTYLHRLILLECAACASAEATIGFLNLADSTTPSKDKSENVYKNFQDEFKGIVPWFPALIAYNKAVAFSHTSRREEALKQVGEAIRLVRNSLDSGKSRDQDKNEDTSLKKSDLRFYLEVPALHLHADLLNKMQCCFNAVETLKKVHYSIDQVSEELGKEKTIYKRIRALLLEVLCWLDMGDQYQAFKVVEKILDRCGPANELIPKEVIKEFKERPWKGKGELGRNEYQEILNKKPALRTDAIKLILQLDLESWKNCLTYINVPNESVIEKAGDLIRSLKEFISAYHHDRFQRQNLKEIAVDWLEWLSKIKKIKEQGNSDEKQSISSEKWRDAIENVLGCLGNDQHDSIPPFEKSGDIANEIWGDDFKYLAPTVVEKMQNILSGLIDECEMFFHDNKHQPNKGGPCNHPKERIFLAELAAFEMKVLGLKMEDGTPYELVKEGLFPKQGTYEYRRAIRRGRVLLKYRKISEMQNGNCKDKKTCFGSTKEELAWLGQEKWVGQQENEWTYKDIDVCFRKLQEAWFKGEVESKVSAADHPTLWLQDYERIVGDSDFLRHLQPGRSAQPVHLFEERQVNGDKNEKRIGVEFVALRRWNSYTPEISFSKGGGYFVFVPAPQKTQKDGKEEDQLGGVFRTTQLGIVVDPGFDYIHNFFSQGFTLDDIDIVLITHADADHVNDFSGLADLLRERANRRRGSEKKVYTFIPKNAHEILNRYITEKAFRLLYYDTILVDAQRHLTGEDQELQPFTLELCDGNGVPTLRIIKNISTKQKGTLRLRIQPVNASHDDHAGGEPGSFGYVLKFTEGPQAEEIAAIGFTGDSQWFPEFSECFKECGLICSHMGSVLGDKAEDYRNENQSLGSWEALIRKKNHPYLPGEILFLEQLRKLGDKHKDRIVVLSEFGEELKGLIRKDICERLNRCMSEKESDGCWMNFVIQPKNPEEEGTKIPRCDECEENRRNRPIRTIPADVGLRISVRANEKPMVHCVLCDRFHNPDDVEWIPHGGEEALFYVCGPCYRSKSRDIRIAKYESLLEFGRPVTRIYPILADEK